MLDPLKIEIQGALDDLFSSGRIPFKLVARNITEDSAGILEVHFYDSRLRSVVVENVNEDSVASQVRSVVLQSLGVDQSQEIAKVAGSPQ